MFKFAGTLLAAGLVGSSLFAQVSGTTTYGQGQDSTQEPVGGRCAMPDTITVTGNSQVEEATIRGAVGLVPHKALNFPDFQRAVKALFSTGKFDDVQAICIISPTTHRVTLNIVVKERPILASTSVIGVDQVSTSDVQALVELPVGSPLNPAAVARAVTRVDSLYQSEGYTLATVHVDTTFNNGQVDLKFGIDEGHRLAISGVKVLGNKNVSGAAVVSSMVTKPEGFWWFRSGEFDKAAYDSDLTNRVPELYGSRGYIDFRVLHDTLLTDPSRGKGELQVAVEEGPRYTVGSFEVLGNRHFSAEEIDGFFPFHGQGQSLAQGTLGILHRSYKNPPGTFDEAQWKAATDHLSEAYRNAGYMYAKVVPIVERVPSTDSVRKVNLRWEIEEGAPVLVKRIDIVGNDYTYESCIREQIVMAPGQVFREDYLIRSYQNISNLNFFESPMPEPVPKPDSVGDMDLTFTVKEKRTGNINFGASEGQGTGIGGFIGFDQPNLFGRCKRAQVQWQFGQYVNNFNLTYQDPNILQSRISGSVTGYHTLARYTIADLGQSTTTGGQLQFGFPIPNSYYSRVFLSYGGEAVRYADNGGTLLSTLATTCSNCFRSSLGLTYQHDTRVGMPFPMGGALQTITAQADGGPLGGTATFQKVTTELRSYAPIASIGANTPGSQPMTFLVGLSARAGTVIGNPGPFFSTQSFALGGTQYGEQLRGYCEFSITPAGYDPSACNGTAKVTSFGNAFFVGTAELGFRVNQMLYLDGFYEGGNIWAQLREFDPTRLYRSIGVGGSVISPLGPLGLDLAYGFDRIDATGHRTPGWKVHFKLGQIF